MASAPTRQVAVITGAGSGIGLGCAVKLAEAGMSIVGVGRSPEKLKALERAIGDPDRLATLSVDITEDTAPKRIMDLAVGRWGKVDFLINNAGIGSPKPLHEADDANFDYFVAIMLRAPFRLAREALAYMPPGSAIINITSTFAVVGGLRGGAYSAAKAGLTGLTRHIACQYGATGIRANAVAPGVILTEMTEGRLEDESFRRMNLEMTPHTRMGTVNDVASTVAFLCSPGGSFINGQEIVVDGGWTSTKFLSEFGRTATWAPGPLTPFRDPGPIRLGNSLQPGEAGISCEVWFMICINLSNQLNNRERHSLEQGASTRDNSLADRHGV